MAEPALREQLTSYIARRVCVQADSLLQFHDQCISSDWRNPTEIKDLLESSEKLTKLASKLPNNEIAEFSRQISSLLKLENITEKPSHRTRNGVLAATQHIAKSALLEQSQAKQTESQGDNYDHLRHAVLALNDTAFKASLMSLLRDLNWRCSELNQVSTLNEECCLFVDTDYKSLDGGFELAARLTSKKSETTCGAIIYVSNTDSLDKRLKATRKGATGFIVNPPSASELLQQTNQILGQIIELSPKVLVVDDSLSQLKYVENILLKEGFQCKAISDPNLFLPTMKEYRPDVVLLDMYMPSCSGLELAQVLRQHPEFKATPYIFLSAEDDKDILAKTKAATNAPFITKPARPDTLISKIRTLTLQKDS